MLLDLFRGGFSPEKLIDLGLYVIVILISLSVHELCHGYAAYRCGDATARNFGRLTLNPLAHLDPIGTIMMLVFGFGYAKAVPINPRNFNHYKRDLCIVSFAGPFSNLVLCLIGTLAFQLSWLFTPFIPESFAVPYMYWLTFCNYFLVANASLAIFNLLPIPPLDGSRIVSTLLPSKIAYYYLKYEQYIMIAVMFLLFQGTLDGILSTLTSFILDGMFWITELVLTPLANLLF